MHDLNQSSIEAICNQVFDGFRGILSWKWDDWIGTILAEFSADKEEDIRAILERFFPISCDSSTIKTAPQIVQTLNKQQLGGLRPTQLLYTSHPSHDALLFCAWWPWGNGMIISLRIGFFSDKNLSKIEKNRLLEQLKVWAEI